MLLCFDALKKRKSFWLGRDCPFWAKPGKGPSRESIPLICQLTNAKLDLLYPAFTPQETALQLSSFQRGDQAARGHPVAQSLLE